MNYYTLAIIGSPLGEFSYHSSKIITIGTKVQVVFNNREKYAVILKEASKPEFDTNEILEITGETYSSKQIELAQFISKYYICSLGDAFSLMMPYLNNKDSDSVDVKELAESTIELSEKQTKALTFLQEKKVGLLFGDTGSGKTEIYMKYFEQMIAEGKRSIFLMPEISLTPQMNMRLEEHFGEAVVMWHSKLTPKQKRVALEKIHNGEAMILAGPRSALFLPIHDLGLIVVDEEHDDSYKSSSRPRYNAQIGRAHV